MTAASSAETLQSTTDQQHIVTETIKESAPVSTYQCQASFYTPPPNHALQACGGTYNTTTTFALAYPNIQGHGTDYAMACAPGLPREPCFKNASLYNICKSISGSNLITDHGPGYACHTAPCICCGAVPGYYPRLIDLSVILFLTMGGTSAQVAADAGFLSLYVTV
jgi:hypothetical protein